MTKRKNSEKKYWLLQYL